MRFIRLAVTLEKFADNDQQVVSHWRFEKCRLELISPAGLTRRGWPSTGGDY
jgi:hypothetical protein